MDQARRTIENHIEIIEELETRDTDRAERIIRDHTLHLTEYVEKHVDLD